MTWWETASEMYKIKEFIFFSAGIFYGLFGTGPSWFPVNSPFLRFWFRLFFADAAFIIWIFQKAFDAPEPAP